MNHITTKIANSVKGRTRNFINHKVIHPIDCQLNRHNKTLSYRPIFIIGAPRSGSTLLMQVLTDAFDFGYFSNLHNTFFGAPSLAEKFLYAKERRSVSSYRSKHGLVDGRLAPSECGEYWYRFFPRKPLYAPLSAIDPQDMMAFRRSLISVTQACKRPVLFKNMFAALRLEPILKYIPEALFIVIDRNEIENAHSLLEVRKKLHNDYDQWWSMEPPNIEALIELPAATQVIEQIRQIHRLIESDFKASNIDGRRILRVNYEEFCADVPSCIEQVELFLENNNSQVDRLFEVPEKFEIRTESSIPTQLLDEVKAYAEKF